MSEEKDIRRLKLLGIFHCVLSGVIALVAFCASDIALSGITSSDGFAYYFGIMWGVGALLGWGLAICLFTSGRILWQHKWRTFSIITAGITILLNTFAIFITFVEWNNRILLIFFVPFFIFGVFTLVMLNKKSVKELYKKNLRNLRMT